MIIDYCSICLFIGSDFWVNSNVPSWTGYHQLVTILECQNSLWNTQYAENYWKGIYIYFYKNYCKEQECMKIIIKSSWGKLCKEAEICMCNQAICNHYIQAKAVGNGCATLNDKQRFSWDLTCMLIWFLRASARDDA